MHRSTLSILACPSCSERFQVITHRGSDERVEQGLLRCSCRAAVVPILDGYALFTHALLHADFARPEALAALSSRLFGNATEFVDYCRHKQVRNVIEVYAALHPFNESGRAVEPLLPHIRPAVRASGFILDVWNRTGWNGEWLAVQFPEQRVVSMWEGDSSVLGYRGFRHLLDSTRRSSNLDIIFCHPEQPLPFRDAAIDLLYAHDVLHRYATYPFATECLRVTRPDGALVFPHVHLANSEPEPFFERGGTKLHGREYRQWLDEVTAGTARRGFVFDESALFTASRLTELTDDHLTTHYNGLIAILPETEPVDRPVAKTRFIANPIFRIAISRGTARVHAESYDGAVGHYLARHPVYTARLPRSPVVLDDLSLLTIHLAAGGAEREQLAACVDGGASLDDVVDRMSAAELILPVPVSRATHYLQRFHANQHAMESEAVLTDCLVSLEQTTGVLMSASNGPALTGGDLLEFAQRLATWLRQRQVTAADWIGISPRAEPLLWFAAVAAANVGVNVRLLEDDHSCADLQLQLCPDGEDSGNGWVALGLDGSSNSLLAQMESLGDLPRLPATGAGSIELESLHGKLRIPIGLLAAGCVALRLQRAPGLLMLGNDSRLVDLLIILTMLVDCEPLHGAVAC